MNKLQMLPDYIETMVEMEDLKYLKKKSEIIKSIYNWQQQLNKMYINGKDIKKYDFIPLEWIRNYFQNGEDIEIKNKSILCEHEKLALPKLGSINYSGINT